MQDRGETPSLPDNPAPHVIDWLLEIGPTASSGMGECPIGWQDMAAWERLSGIELEPWEARAIRDLSAAYLAERHKARKPDCPPPYSGEREDIVSDRERVARKVKAAFGNLKRKALQARG